MNRETVHSVKEKSMYRNALQLNTDIKERTNEEGLMNHRKGKEKKEAKKKAEKKRERTRNMCNHQGFHATEVQKTKQKRNKQWHRKDIHSHIHSNTHSMHTPKTLKKWNNKKKRRSTYETWCLRLLVLFLSTVVMGDGQEIWHLLLRTASRRRPSRLGQYWQKIFVDVFNTLSNISRQKCPF